MRSACIGKSDFKKIEDTVDKPYYDRMHHRMQTEKAKRLKKVRSSTVEPVLGTLTNFLAMKRVNTRGIKGANKCMLMAAVAYNLKKLLKWQLTDVMINVKEMKIKAKKPFLTFFRFQRSVGLCNIENILIAIHSTIRAKSSCSQKVIKVLKS